MDANILKTLSTFVLDILKQNTESNEELVSLASEKDAVEELAVKLEKENGEKIKIIETMELSICEMKKKDADLEQSILQLEECLKLECDKLKSVTEELQEKDRLIISGESAIKAITAENCRLCAQMEKKEMDFSNLQADIQRKQNELHKTNEYYNLATKSQSDLMEKLSNQEKHILEKDNKLFDIMEQQRALIEEKMYLQRDVEIMKNHIKEIERELLSSSETSSSCQKELEQNKLDLENAIMNKKDGDKKLNQYQKRTVKLEKENASLKETLSQLKTEKQTLEKEMDLKELEMKENQASMESNSDRLLAEIDAYKAQMIHKEGEINLYKTRIANLEEQSAAVAELEVTYTENIKSLEKEISSKSFLMLSHEKDIENLTKENANLKRENENVSVDLKLCQNQTYEKQSEVLLLTEKLERAHADLQRTKEFHDVAAKTESELSERFKCLENSLKEKDNKITVLNEMEKRLMVDIAKLQRDNTEIEEKFMAMKTSLEEISNLKNEKQSQIEYLTSSLNDSQVQNDFLVKQIDEYLQKENSYRDTLECQRSELEKILLEKGDLLQEIEACRNKETYTSDLNKLLEHKVFELEQRETQVKKHLNQMKEEFDIVSKEKDNLEDKVESLEKDIATNEKDIDSVNLECKKMMSFKDELLNRFSESEQRNRELCEIIDGLKLDYNVVSNDKYDLEEKIEILEKELLQFKDNHSSLKRDLSDLQILKTETQSRLDYFEQNDYDNKMTIEALNKQISAFESNNKELSRKMHEIDSLHIEKNKEFEDLKRDFDDMSNKMHSKEIEITDLHNCNEEKTKFIGILQKEISSLNEKKDTLESNIATLEIEKDKMIEKYEKTNQELSSVISERNHMEHNLGKTNENYSETCMLLKAVKCELDDLKKEFSLLQQSSNDERSCSENLRIEYVELTAKAETLQQELSQSFAKHKEADEECRVLRKEIEQLEAAKDTLAVTIQNVEEHSQHIQGILDDLFLRLSHILFESLGVEIEHTLSSQSMNEKLIELTNHLGVSCTKKMSEMQELQLSYDSKCTEVSTLLEEISTCLLKEKEYTDRIEEQNLALNDAEKVETRLHETVAENEILTEVKTKLLVEKELLCQELETERKKCKSLIDEAEREKDQIKLDILTEKKETEIMRTKVNEDKKVICSLSTDLERIHIEKNTLEGRLSEEKCSLEAEIVKLSEEKKNYSQEISTLTLRLKKTDTTVKESQCIIDQQKANLFALSENVRDLQEKLSYSEEKFERKYQDYVELSNAKGKQESELKQIISDLEMKQSETENKWEEAILNIQSVNQQVGLKTAELDSIYMEKEAVEQTCLQLERITENLKSEVNTLNLQLDESYILSENLNQELEVSKSKLLETANRLEQVLDEHKQMWEKLELAVRNHEQCKTEVACISATLLESKSELECVRTENCEMAQTVSLLTSEKEETNKTISALKNSNDEQNIIISDINVELLKLNEKYEKACLNESRVSMVLQEKVDSLLELQGELEKYKENYAAIQLQLESFKEEAKTRNEKLTDLENIQSEKETLLNENKLLEEKNRETLVKLDIQAEKCNQLRESVDVMKEKLTKMKEEVESVRKNKATEVESLRQEITALEFQLSAEQLQNREVQKVSLKMEKVNSINFCLCVRIKD